MSMTSSTCHQRVLTEGRRLGRHSLDGCTRFHRMVDDPPGHPREELIALPPAAPRPADSAGSACCRASYRKQCECECVSVCVCVGCERLCVSQRERVHKTKAGAKGAWGASWGRREGGGARGGERRKGGARGRVGE